MTGPVGMPPVGNPATLTSQPRTALHLLAQSATPGCALEIALG